MAPPKLFLFVYGSLKKGFRHHAELRGAKFQRPARTEPRYRLVRAGDYPVLLAHGAERISGELFEVSREALDRLDEFEGPAYARRAVALEGGIQAMAYFGDPRAFRECASIPEGEWKK